MNNIKPSESAFVFNNRGVNKKTMWEKKKMYHPNRAVAYVKKNYKTFSFFLNFIATYNIYQKTSLFTSFRKYKKSYWNRVEMLSWTRMSKNEK